MTGSSEFEMVSRDSFALCIFHSSWTCFLYTSRLLRQHQARCWCYLRKIRQLKPSQNTYKRMEYVLTTWQNIFVYEYLLILLILYNSIYSRHMFPTQSSVLVFYFICKCESVSGPVVSDSLWPIDGSPPGSSAHGILQARILEWPATQFQKNKWPNQKMGQRTK